MKAPKEIMYINPDIYQGETGTSAIANVSMNSPIVYGENPNLTTNEFGETSVVQTPIFIGEPLTPKEQAQQLVDDIKETLAELKKEEEEKPKKDFGTIIESNKKLDIAKTNPTPIKPTTNYLLYGAIGVGAVIVLFGILKK
jgi:hypothetical protein